MRVDSPCVSSVSPATWGAYAWGGLKIALVILHADPARGGAERYTIDLATALRGRGHTVALIASSFAAGVQQAGNVQLDTGTRTRLGGYLQFLDQLDRHFAGHRYDVSHAMLPVRACDVYHPHAGIALEASNAPDGRYEGPVMQVISRVAGRLNRRRQRFGAVENALLGGPRPPIVLCLSDYVKQIVRRRYPTLDERYIAMLFNAVDLDRFDPSLRPDAGAEVRSRFGIDPAQTVGLIIAQDFGRKGLREAILATAFVRDPRFTLLVVGKEDPATYRRLVNEKQLGSSVIFAGRTDDPYAFYRAADLFLLPTRRDPCSLVVLESLAMGVPVVSTALNGACEIMTSGTHGFVLDDPADVPRLASAIRSLLDEGARKTMAASCLALRPRLAYGTHLDALCEIYQRVAAAR